ncbi:MAG: class I SAM-dependent methyltransferase [Nitrospinota bacterium]
MRRKGNNPRFLLIDCNPQVLACAQEFLKNEAGISFVRGDARALPLREGGCDWALCVQLLHQFDPAEARAALGELDRAARLGVLVADVRRSAPLHFLLRLLMSAWGSALTRHDAPLSLRRAYTAREAQGLARGAKLHHLRARSCPPAHWQLLGRKA